MKLARGSETPQARTYEALLAPIWAYPLADSTPYYLRPGRRFELHLTNGTLSRL